MSQIVDEVVLDRTLPGIWEGLRAVSGLVAVLALLLLLIGAALRDAAAPKRAGEPAVPREKVITLHTNGPETLAVFYLVQSPEQAQIADRTESEAAMEALAGYRVPTRISRVLYAPDDGALSLAAQAILYGLLGSGKETLVHVIDLRAVAAAPVPGASEWSALSP